MSQLEASPFDRHYGLEVDEAGDELVRAHVPVVKHVTQPLGLVHGGVYASIAEALASLGTNIGVVPRGSVGLGMSNHSTFLRPISQGTIHAGPPRPWGRRPPPPPCARSARARSMRSPAVGTAGGQRGSGTSS